MLGKEVVAADGQIVKIHSISHSFRYPNMAVINEDHFIDYLELFSQLSGEVLDDEDRELWKNLIVQTEKKKQNSNKN